MAYEVIMPKSGMAMEEGKIVRWLKKEGDKVTKGEPLLEIETDKVNMEVEAMATGFLVKIFAGEGETIPVTQVIGYIGEKDEKVSEPVRKAAIEEAKQQETAEEAVIQNSLGKNDKGRIAATPLAKTLAKSRKISLDKIKPTGKQGQILAKDIETVKQIAATPLAYRIAEDKGIELDNVAGSGHKGKITKADVENYGTQSQVINADEIKPHSSMRKVIAKRMVQSHLEIPPVTQSCIADVTDLLELRKKINQSSDNHVSLNDFIVLSVAKTLEEQPHINSSYSEEGLIIKKDINIGIAVALPEGLIVPVIKNANKLSLNQISKISKSLIVKAKEGTLSYDDYSGGTFTTSNLGMMGVVSFTPIINQPESAILGVCAVTQQLEMDDEGKIYKKSKMGLSLTYDHRSIDGAQAAIFSNRIIELLENPMLMLI